MAKARTPPRRRRRQTRTYDQAPVGWEHFLSCKYDDTTGHHQTRGWLVADAIEQALGYYKGSAAHEYLVEDVLNQDSLTNSLTYDDED